MCPNFRRSRSGRELIAEHRKTAARLLARGLVLDDVPVLREHAVLHAHDVSDDPRRRWPETAETSMENDEITRCRRNVVLVAQRRGQGLDQAKQPVTAGRNMCAVLDVTRRPEALGGGVVALVEEGIKRVQDGLDVAVFTGLDHGKAPRSKIKSLRKPRIISGPVGIYMLGHRWTSLIYSCG